MFWNLLSTENTPNNDWVMWVVLGIGVLLLGIMFFVNHRSQKKRQEEVQATLDALRPGCKVKTIGGICGVVVEVSREENTFVLETGSETSGKHYIKFDMIAIYQTDAKKEDAPVEEAPAAEVAEPAPAEEVFEETATEETPAEEAKEE